MGGNQYQLQGEVKYNAAHLRARSHLPMRCAMRSKNCSGPLEVAFNWKETPRRFWRYEGTRIYSCDPNHYIRLCRRHHSQYDYGRKAPLISRKAVLREIRRRQSVVF